MAPVGDDVSLQFDNLWTLTLSTLLYGIYLVVFVLATYLFITRRKRRTMGVMRSPIFVASCFLWAAITANWILTVYRPFQGFVFYRDGQASTEFFASLFQPSETAQNSCLTVSFAIGDGMIIYRLYAIWPNIFVIALPVVSWAGFISAQIFTIVETATVEIPTPAVKGITVAVALTLVTNIYCTVCIGLRIWRIASSSKIDGFRGHTNLTRVLSIFVESAAGFTGYFILYAILHGLNLEVQFGLINSAPAAVGLANALIAARVALARPGRETDAELQPRGGDTSLVINSVRFDTVDERPQTRTDVADSEGRTTKMELSVRDSVRSGSTGLDRLKHASVIEDEQ